jgi:hypothetical protein
LSSNICWNDQKGIFPEPLPGVAIPQIVVSLKPVATRRLWNTQSTAKTISHRSARSSLDFWVAEFVRTPKLVETAAKPTAFRCLTTSATSLQTSFLNWTDHWSVLMDSETIDSYFLFAIPDKTNQVEAPENLTADEQATFLQLINNRVRLKQEKLPA